MTVSMQIEQRRRAMLIQTLEKLWPGCGAHSKRDRDTGRMDVVFGDVVPPVAIDAMRLYIKGWEAGGAALLACLQADALFPDADTAALVRRQSRQQPAARPRADRPKPAAQGAAGRDERAARAQAGLEALFSPTQRTGDDHDA